MSSISVAELKTVLNNVPDDYEVIMEIKEKFRDENGKLNRKESIAYINGIRRVDSYNEVRLMN